MLKKKLPVWGAVLVVAGLLAAPAFAQTADLTEAWGSDQWLINQFGIKGDITPFCQTVEQKPDAEAGWVAQFPNLADLCGWSQSQGSSQPQQTSQGSSQPQTSQGTSQPQTPQGTSQQPQSSPSQSSETSSG